MLPMIAGLSANHLAALELPPALRRLYVTRDNDAAGLNATERLRVRATEALAAWAEGTVRQLEWR
jgi:hypothetical protein